MWNSKISTVKTFQSFVVIHMFTFPNFVEKTNETKRYKLLLGFLFYNRNMTILRCAMKRKTLMIM